MKDATALNRDAKKVVICGDYRRFINWCREQDIPPMSVILIDRREKLMGLELREEDIIRLYPVDDITEADIQTRIR